VELLTVVSKVSQTENYKFITPFLSITALKKCIGTYEACFRLRNGNLVANCSAQQMRTLLKCTKLTDGAITVEVTASSLQPLRARGVIYNVQYVSIRLVDNASN